MTEYDEEREAAFQQAMREPVTKGDLLRFLGILETMSLMHTGVSIAITNGDTELARKTIEKLLDIDGIFLSTMKKFANYKPPEGSDG